MTHVLDLVPEAERSFAFVPFPFVVLPFMAPARGDAAFPLAFVALEAIVAAACAASRASPVNAFTASSGMESSVRIAESGLMPDSVPNVAKALAAGVVAGVSFSGADAAGVFDGRRSDGFACGFGARRAAAAGAGAPPRGPSGSPAGASATELSSSPSVGSVTGCGFALGLGVPLNTFGLTGTQISSA